MDSVLSESRCPENANCFWEGNAAVRFVFKNEFVDTSFVLNTSDIDSLANSFSSNALQIKLIKLMPYPATPDPIEYYTYRSEIVIE